MLDLTDRCPSWCQQHELDDDHVAAHERLIGRAGPLRITLVCSVFAGQPDPVSEIWLFSDDSSAERSMTLPPDIDVDRLSDLLRQATNLHQRG